VRKGDFTLFQTDYSGNFAYVSDTIDVIKENLNLLAPTYHGFPYSAWIVGNIGAARWLQVRRFSTYPEKRAKGEDESH
jgi:hypothetical protein